MLNKKHEELKEKIAAKREGLENTDTNRNSTSKIGPLKTEKLIL